MLTILTVACGLAIILATIIAASLGAIAIMLGWSMIFRGVD